MSEFENDLMIDKYALDAECLDQPRRFAKWSEDFADAMAERDRADQAVEIIKSQVELDVRRTPEKYGLEKATEATIKAAVTVNDQVQEAVEKWITAKHRVGVMLAAKEALDHRKSMLENLVKLFLSGYWSDPKIPKDAKEEFSTQDAKKHDEVVGRTLAKRKPK